MIASDSKWNWINRLGYWLSRLTFRPRLAWNVLVRYSKISILHNYQFDADKIPINKPVDKVYITNCNFNS